MPNVYMKKFRSVAGSCKYVIKKENLQLGTQCSFLLSKEKQWKGGYLARNLGTFSNFHEMVPIKAKTEV